MPVELSPSVEKALRAFEDGARKNVDCEALLDNSWQTFSLLERWEKADSNVDSVRSIIKQVKEQGHVYFETLADSISIAESLYELAQDAKQLANSLLDPGHKPEEIKDTRKSRGISTSLRDVRKGINQISDSIPGEMKKLERREDRMLAKNEAVERRIRHARLAKTISTTALAVVVGLPIAILVMEAYEQHISKALLKRNDEIWDCRAGLQQLKDVTYCLEGFGRHVDALIDFWLRSDTMLETISKGVNRIRGDPARIRLKATITLWEEAAESYLNYAAKARCFHFEEFYRGVDVSKHRLWRDSFPAIENIVFAFV
ncbi:hypothetical protein B0H17DRAFT_1235822 [Mycena rosella]|uniref:Uncharacterized protein n=1 Tax=Mycena rosella TaxID=1033263 RepID=A0AAD7GD68_MYCRO|nr:hypothetical protein B0H17DRAFT_1235822 [Mycena rosella]